MTIPRVCWLCGGRGYVQRGFGGVDSSDYPEGAAVPDIMVVRYIDCPAGCDHGILVRAVDIGARASDETREGGSK